MGWSVSRHSDASRKRDLLDRRLIRLRGAVTAGEGPAHIAKAAEKVRLAALALIKAQRALLTEYPERDPDGRHARKLDGDEKQWSTLSTESIVEEQVRRA